MAKRNRTHMPGPVMDDSEIASQRLNRQEFGRRLDALRIKRGWTQSELGRHAGIARGSISEYINGRAYPTTLNLKRLANALGVGEEELLPNVTLDAARAGESSIVFSVNPGDPRRGYLKVEQMVTVDKGIRILAILHEPEAE